MHIELESFSLGKRISNFTMQESDGYQLQTALKMFKNIEYILEPMALELLKDRR